LGFSPQGRQVLAPAFFSLFFLTFSGKKLFFWGTFFLGPFTTGGTPSPFFFGPPFEKFGPFLKKEEREALGFLLLSLPGVGEQQISGGFFFCLVLGP